MNKNIVKNAKDGLILKVVVKPNADRNSLVCIEGDALLVKISAPALGGKANSELIKFLKKTLRCRVSIVSGIKSKVKVVK